MPEIVFESVAQYVFGVLFVSLLWYVLKNNKIREDQLMQHSQSLAESYRQSIQVMQSMQEDQKEMKNEMGKKLDKIYEKVG